MKEEYAGSDNHSPPNKRKRSQRRSVFWEDHAIAKRVIIDYLKQVGV